jgi:hypothetical protein
MDSIEEWSGQRRGEKSVNWKLEEQFSNLISEERKKGQS